jgi:hypothetical protein
MRCLRVLWISAAVGCLAGCPKRDTPTTETQPTKLGSGEKSVTTTSDGWAQAQAIAEKTSGFRVTRWRDDLPYLFQAKGTRGVLVHNGAVVTARGPAVAGAYLRDLGILDGKGPSPGTIMTLLFVLHAFPEVPDVPEQGAFDELGPKDLQPRVERAHGHALVILNYGLPSDNPGPDRGTRPVMRETLDIGPTGDAAWTGAQFEWKAP